MTYCMTNSSTGFLVLTYEQVLWWLQIHLSCFCGDIWCCLALVLVSAIFGNLATSCALI